ncbi:hypothetical protein BH11CYA1_BH11CYA1_16300 [soil metagenome]
MQNTADSESAALADVVRLARGLPIETKNAVTKLCVDYNQEVQYVEWEAMEHGQMSRKAGLQYLCINDAVLNFMPTNNKENNIQNALITVVQQLGDYRHTRLNAMHSTWCRRILPVLVLCSAIALANTYLYTRRDRRRLHVIVISFVAICLGANNAMIVLLRTPFSTDWKIGSVANTGSEIEASFGTC